MEIRVNPIGHARGRRFILLSLLLLCLASSHGGSPIGTYLWGRTRGNKGAAPSIIRYASKRSALVRGITGDSPVPPETWRPAHFTSGSVSAEGCVCASVLPDLVPGNHGKVELHPHPEVQLTQARWMRSWT